MSLYKEFSSLLPYLQSVRKLENYLIFDVSFPTTWKLPKKYVDEKMVVEQKSAKPEFRCFSFATSFDEETLDKLFNNLKNIIKYNKEREEKEKLFEEKVKELKSFFDKSNLTDLKSLEFQVSNDYKLVELEEDEDKDRIPRESVELV